MEHHSTPRLQGGPAPYPIADLRTTPLSHLAEDPFGHTEATVDQILARTGGPSHVVAATFNSAI